MKFLCKVSVACCLAALPLLGAAEPYRSLNEVCVVEKKGEGYTFLNNRELSAKAQQIFQTQRDHFEWFFMEDGQLKAKVYPAMRDAILEVPGEVYKQTIKSCPRTDVNVKLAPTLEYAYRSQDPVCACLFERGQLNCAAVKGSQLASTPFEKLVLFFETTGYPASISHPVPEEISKVWDQCPGYKQRITVCQHSTTNEELAKEWGPQLRNARR